MGTVIPHAALNQILVSDLVCVLFSRVGSQFVAILTLS